MLFRTTVLFHYLLPQDIPEKDDRSCRCIIWHREGSGLLAEVVDPRSLLSLHNGAVRHLEHLRSHRPVCREGEEEENGGWIGIQVFGWTDSTIALFTLWGCLDYAIWFLPSALLLSQSLRYSVVLFPSKPKIYSPTLHLPEVAASFCMLAGACLRCLPLLIPSMGSSFTALCHAGRYLFLMILYSLINRVLNTEVLLHDQVLL